jgi:hypothetical protein
MGAAGSGREGLRVHADSDDLAAGDSEPGAGWGTARLSGTGAAALTVAVRIAEG